MKTVLLLLLISAALLGAAWCLRRLDRQIDQALAEPCDLELGVRHVYDTEKLERELLEGARPQ